MQSEANEQSLKSLKAEQVHKRIRKQIKSILAGHEFVHTITSIYAVDHTLQNI